MPKPHRRRACTNASRRRRRVSKSFPRVSRGLKTLESPSLDTDSARTRCKGLNKFTHRLELTLGAVSDKAGRLKMIDVHGGNLGRVFILKENDTSRFVEVQSRRLDVLLKDATESILVMKMDIEGHEPAALKGASRLLEKRMIQNISLEVSPLVTGIEDAVDMLRRLWQHGFTRVQELHYTPPQEYGKKMKTRSLVFDADSSTRDFVERLMNVGDIRGERFTDLLLSLER